jgi:hypothetical protein
MLLAMSQLHMQLLACSPPPFSACPPFPAPRSEFEVDFVSLSYCRSADDVYETRDFLNSINAEHTKVQRLPCPQPSRRVNALGSLVTQGGCPVA